MLSEAKKLGRLTPRERYESPVVQGGAVGCRRCLASGRKESADEESEKNTQEQRQGSIAGIGDGHKPRSLARKFDEPNWQGHKPTASAATLLLLCALFAGPATKAASDPGNGNHGSPLAGDRIAIDSFRSRLIHQ